MSTVAEIKLWGSRIGAVALQDDEDVASFEYDEAFVNSGIQLAPLVMPLRRGVYRFPSLSYETFRGLPGLLADSLPDRFGNALIDAWLATQGRTSQSFNAVERLCYTGSRGMGALEFAPAIGPRADAASKIRVDKLVELAAQVLAERDNLRASFAGRDKELALRSILRVGTSAGGGRAKAVIAWNPSTNEVRSGQAFAGEGFGYWILKFDGVAGNRDKDLADPLGYGTVEFAYNNMGRAAGIAMAESRLLEEGGRRHFMSRRFDRLKNGEKLHMQSLGALAHLDFNSPGAHSYEQALLAIRQLGLAIETIEEQFRRMVFNIAGRNQDDHVKNIAFLMDKTGKWSLSPAFDMTYSHNPSGKWTSRHQMSLNGKQDGFTVDDFIRCASGASMKRGRAQDILHEVLGAVSRWRDYADEAGVSPAYRDDIQANLRLDLET